MAQTLPEQQHVLVMRHGERADKDANKSWWTTVRKPWDPSLTPAGLESALEIGKELRTRFEFRIDRVVVSPFLRCIETARELIRGLFEDEGDGSSAYPSTSRIKVSIEYGMCEMLNDTVIWYHPTDRNSWGFNIQELESSFPSNLAEVTQDRVFMEMPQWGETESSAKDRYLRTIHSLVDKYPEENLLFITHGEGVKVAASTHWREEREAGETGEAREARKAREEARKAENFEVTCLGYACLRRQIVQNGDSFTANSFRNDTNPDIIRGTPTSMRVDSTSMN